MSIITVLTGLPSPAVYGAVAALIGVESLGIPVPGETGLIAAALIAVHPVSQVTPLGVFLSAWAGAVVGDSIGYAIGRRYGTTLFTRLGRRFPRHFSPAHLAYAAHLFHRHGATAVFTGRFVALLRILAGPLAGSMHLRYPRFLLANAAGGAAWAGAITMLVAALGAAAHTLVAGAGWGLFILLSVAGLVLSRRIHRAFQDRVERFAAAQRDDACPTPPLS